MNNIIIILIKLIIILM